MENTPICKAYSKHLSIFISHIGTIIESFFFSKFSRNPCVIKRLLNFIYQPTLLKKLNFYTEKKKLSKYGGARAVQELRGQETTVRQGDNLAGTNKLKMVYTYIGFYYSYSTLESLYHSLQTHLH